jgi:hypothetical protein
MDLAEECQKECQSEDNCNYWTWVAPDSFDLEKQCFLKTRVVIRKQEYYGKKTISGPKYCHGMYYC